MVSLAGAEGWAVEDRRLAWGSVSPGVDLTFRSRRVGVRVRGLAYLCSVCVSCFSSWMSSCFWDEVCL